MLTVLVLPPQVVKTLEILRLLHSLRSGAETPLPSESRFLQSIIFRLETIELSPTVATPTASITDSLRTSQGSRATFHANLPPGTVCMDPTSTGIVASASLNLSRTPELRNHGQFLSQALSHVASALDTLPDSPRRTSQLILLVSSCWFLLKNGSISNPASILPGSLQRLLLMTLQNPPQPPSYPPPLPPQDPSSPNRSTPPLNLLLTQLVQGHGKHPSSNDAERNHAML